MNKEKIVLNDIHQEQLDYFASVIKSTKLATRLRLKAQKVLANDIVRQDLENVSFEDNIKKSGQLMFLDRELYDVSIQKDGDNILQAVIDSDLQQDLRRINENENFSFLDYILNWQFKISVELGGAQLELLELASLQNDDVICLDKQANSPCDVVLSDYGLRIALGEVVVVDDCYFGVRIVKLAPTVNWFEEMCKNISLILSGDFAIERTFAKPGRAGAIAAYCVLGTTRLTIKELLGIGENSILQLDCSAGSPVDLVFDSSAVPSLKCEAVVIDDTLAVRLQMPKKNVKDNIETLCNTENQEETEVQVEKDRNLLPGFKPDTQNVQQLLEFLNKSDSKVLLDAVRQEPLHVLALVLSVLDKKVARHVLSALTDEKGTDFAVRAIKRIVALDLVENAVIVKVLRYVQQKVQAKSANIAPQILGLDTAVAMLEIMSPDIQQTILESLARDSPDLAKNITDCLFMFDDIVMLDDRAIQKVMRDIEMQDLALALKSSSSEIQDKIFKNMSKRAASMLKEDMEFMGPVAIKKVEEARQKIVSIVKHLEETGEIITSLEDRLII